MILEQHKSMRVCDFEIMDLPGKKAEKNWGLLILNSVTYFE